MSSTVIDFEACRTQLANNNTGGFFKVIATAEDIDPVERDTELPAAYVYPGFIDADPIGDGAVRQQLHNTIHWDIVCPVDDLREAVSILRAAFLGWEMDGYHGPFRLASTGYLQSQAAGPMDLMGGVIRWQERYQNSTHTRVIHN